MSRMDGVANMWCGGIGIGGFLLEWRCWLCRVVGGRSEYGAGCVVWKWG